MDTPTSRYVFDRPTGRCHLLHSGLEPILSVGKWQRIPDLIGMCKELAKEYDVEAVVTMMKGVKALFDPNNMMNPGKIR
jgi:hypothetical protein